MSNGKVLSLASSVCWTLFRGPSPTFFKAKQQVTSLVWWRNQKPTTRSTTVGIHRQLFTSASLHAFRPKYRHACHRQTVTQAECQRLTIKVHTYPASNRCAMHGKVSNQARTSIMIFSGIKDASQRHAVRKRTTFPGKGRAKHMKTYTGPSHAPKASCLQASSTNVYIYIHYKYRIHRHRHTRTKPKYQAVNFWRQTPTTF